MKYRGPFKLAVICCENVFIRAKFLIMLNSRKNFSHFVGKNTSYSYKVKKSVLTRFQLS